MKDLTPLLSPRSIAVVGASEKFGAGSLVIENLKTLGYEGKIYPVNPRYETVSGLPCYPSLDAVPAGEPVDAVAVLLGYKLVVPVLEEAGRRGVRGAWAFASGFAETGEDGAKLQEKLKRTCDEQGIHFCGPNCVGFANLLSRAALYSAPISPTLRPGNVAVVAQSGSVLLALANSNRGVGFSLLISSGNEAVVDATDYIEFLLEQDHTEVIITFLEGIRRPESFVRACGRAAELGKPIVTLKVGRSGMAQRVAMTHTGALTGSDRVHDALFRKLGVIRVDDLDQLLETTEVLSRCRRKLPRGPRAGMITVSGGEISLVGDLARDLSISFPPLSKEAEEELRRRLPPFTAISNPLDGWGSGDLVETYPACLEVMAREEGLDLVVVSQDSPPGMAEKQIAQYADVARAAVRAAAVGKPVVAFSHVSGGLDPTIRGILEQGNIPFLQGTRESLLAIDHLVGYSRFLDGKKKGENERAGRSPVDLEALREGLRGARRVLSDREAKKVLASYGIPVAEDALAKTAEEALSAAGRIGYPVALKGQSPQIPHKTEAGLVELNVNGPEQLREAFGRICERARSHKADAVLEGVLVQKMIPRDAVEVILGVSRDPSFGPVVVFGLGGVMVELLKDTVLWLPPLDHEVALSMTSEIKGKALLDGFRGSRPADRKALGEALIQVGRMAYDLRDVLISLDLNPLMVLPEGDGVVAVDVVMEAGESGV